MKPYLKHLFLALALTAMTAAYAGGLKPTVETEWFVFSNDGERSYGFLNPGTGEIRYEGMFTAAPSSIFGGVFAYLEKGGGVSVYSAADPDAPQILGDLKGLRHAGISSEGMLHVLRPDSVIEVYSFTPDNAELVFTLDGKKIGFNFYERFTEGVMIVHDKKLRRGAVDKTGRMVVPFKYGDLGIMTNGQLLASDELGKPWACFEYVLNAKGEVVYRFKNNISPYYCIPYLCDNGYYICWGGNQRLLLVNIADKRIYMPEEVTYMEDVFCGDYAPYANQDHKWGILKFDGEKVEIAVEAQYKGITLLPWDPTKFVCKKNDGKIVVMDLNGEELIDFGDEWSQIVPHFTPNWKGFVANKHERKYACYDTDGNKMEFGEVSEFDSLGPKYSYSFVTAHPR
ncbi:MAG: hypothetical protein K2N16_01415 [Muribaculaceae bacterium]|nr:hypothetical protein [Muribaculaceae bacterium]